ncbi:efflux RND transporter periplasmic adaptor subunit [Asticcacaulis benevestitus]|uniref:Hemolysin secretion protein D n=1 Tax=Asticcacaulis benevestitus DSM 16100 = ATCC BAA-896 TaxID=1121022 RepID=V4QW68_9CAUL|nr:efflux RND transporter periplasmic adaptor subunit [Asticcacaulis benevestitus]ESQ83418.1 hemolysin secretion protein D [Asticcacaulis benevestitus DSM 16100 = ATCC BAA-896]
MFDPIVSSIKLERYRKALVVAAVSLSVLAVAGIGTALTTQAASQAAAPAATPVTVAVVATQNVSVWDDFSGHLEAVDRVEIRPRVAGAVKAIHFREGALVKAGDLLVTIDPATYQAEAARAQADVSAASARLTLATSEQARAQRLWNDHAIAQSELESRTNDLKAAEANLAAARASLQSANLNLSYTQVRAPVSGRVGRIEVTVGNLVAAGPQAQMLTTLVSVSPIYASFDADETVINRTIADLGTASLETIPVTVEADNGAPIDGHLQLIDNQFDGTSGTLRARAVFQNTEGKLIPGQFVRVRMGAAQTKPAVLVSELALGTDQSKRFVYVVGADHKVAYREVALGGTANGLRIVTSGLKDGDRVVVSGIQHVGPGSVVTETVAAMDAKTKPEA